MNRRFSAIFAVILCHAGGVMAADSDPGYGPRAGTENAGAALAAKNKAAKISDTSYYKPTQKYYGKGYTVAYGYVPVDERSRKYRSTKLESDHFKLPAGSVATAGDSPRITYFHPRQQPGPP
jgi:hypothetical protein